MTTSSSINVQTNFCGNIMFLYLNLAMMFNILHLEHKVFRKIDWLYDDRLEENLSKFSEKLANSKSSVSNFPLKTELSCVTLQGNSVNSSSKKSSSHTNSKSNSSFKAKNEKASTTRCFKCQNAGHIARDCKQSSTVTCGFLF